MICPQYIRHALYLRLEAFMKCIFDIFMFIHVVITYILGVGDRHLDNLLLTKTGKEHMFFQMLLNEHASLRNRFKIFSPLPGKLFHIDFIFWTFDFMYKSKIEHLKNGPRAKFDFDIKFFYLLYFSLFLCCTSHFKIRNEWDYHDFSVY